MKALFDTNILIDYLNGIEDARKEIGLYDQNMDALLITRNTRDFPEDSPGVRVPYRKDDQ